MLHRLRTALYAALLSVLTVAPALAQQFPQTLPANTVVGRLGISPGPAQAIPFASFSANFLNGLCTTAGAFPVYNASASPPKWACSTANPPSINGGTGTFSFQGGNLKTGSGYTGNWVVEMVAPNDGYHDNVLALQNKSVNPSLPTQAGNTAIIFAPWDPALGGGEHGAVGYSALNSVHPNSYYPNSMYVEGLTTSTYPNDDTNIIFVLTHSAGTTRFPSTGYRPVWIEGATGNVYFNSSPNVGTNAERLGFQFTSLTHTAMFRSTDGATILNIFPPTTGQPIQIFPTGTDSVIALLIGDRGGAGVSLTSRGTNALFASNPASAVNYATVSGSIASSPVVLGAAGTDASIDINVTPKNLGQVFVPRMGVTGTAGTGFINLVNQSGANPGTPSSALRIFSNSVGALAWITTDAHIRTLTGVITADRTWTFPDASGTVLISAGGATIPTIATGDLLYGSATNVLSALSDVATGNALISGGVGVAPAWGKIALTTHVSGILPAANGGTGIANSSTLTLAGTLSLPSVAQGDLWYGSATGVISALAKDTGTSRFLKNSGTSNNPAWAQPTFADLSGGTAPAFTLGGTVSGGGNQINNVIIGTTTPLAGTFTALITSGNTFHGPTPSTADAIVTISANTVATAAPSITSNLHIVGANATFNTAYMDAFGSQNLFYARRSNGTPGARTALAANDGIFNFGAIGFDGTADAASGASIIMAAAATWTTSDHSTYIDFYTVPGSSTTAARGLRVNPSGGISVGTTSDPGLGMIYTNAATFMIRTKTSYSTGAGAGAGTITNAPSAGNPTKWIPIDDNGTTRYIPAW